MQPFEKELQRIARFLNRDDYQAARLWDVLSALRGPDDHRTSKGATTGVIRYMMGLDPKCDRLPISLGPDSWKRVDTRTELDKDDHFEHHARNAFEALGLDWDNLNQEGRRIDPNTHWYDCIIGRWGR